MADEAMVSVSVPPAVMVFRNAEDGGAVTTEDAKRAAEGGDVRVYFDEQTGLAYRSSADGARPYVGKLCHLEDDRVVVALDGTD